MQAEIEVKFLNIDIDAFRTILLSAGAECEVPMRLMRRVIIETEEHKATHAWIRIRDEGDKATLTFKRRTDPLATVIDNVNEIEVVVSDFDKTVELFREAGLEYRSFQESRRETWRLGDAEVVIDEWPWLPPYIEIEAETEAAVRAAAEQFGLEWNDAYYGHIDNMYEAAYGFVGDLRGVVDVKDVRFGTPVPEQFAKREA